MRVLVACEFSGNVRDAFRVRGHDAWSCDLLPCDSLDDWHIQGDVLSWLNEGWDLLIAHPPCTYLTVAANSSFAGEKGIDRWLKRLYAAEFFMEFMNAPIPQICVENPVGYMNTSYRKPDQIIHPYYFGDPMLKRTCLWLKGLPQLEATSGMRKPEPLWRHHSGRNKGKAVYFTDAMSPSPQRAHERSRTFQGIADAMAEQWGGLGHDRCL